MTYVRLSHHGDGPQLETSLPPYDPGYPERMSNLASYASAYYEKLVEYARTDYAPTEEGAYRDLFHSPVRHPAQGQPLTPEQEANTKFNLILKLHENDGQIFFIVAPTADSAERSTLSAARDETKSVWERLLNREIGTLPAMGVVYHWLPDENTLRLWPEEAFLPQLETDVFQRPPQQ